MYPYNVLILGFGDFIGKKEKPPRTGGSLIYRIRRSLEAEHDAADGTDTVCSRDSEVAVGRGSCVEIVQTAAHREVLGDGQINAAADLRR
jgi:hypothetical protein